MEDEGEKLEVVIKMEVVENVQDVDILMQEKREMVKKGGMMLVEKINRKMKEYGIEIIGEEYVMRWIKRGKNKYEKMVRKEEMEEEF